MKKRIKLFDCLPLTEKIERWENAIRVLKRLTPHERRKHWQMGWWGEKNECGTVACAAGHCALDPWFRRRGLRMDFHYLRRIKVWELEFNSGCVGEFFGEEGTRSIFYDGSNRSVACVIREIKHYIRFLKTDPPPTATYAGYSSSDC